MAQGFSVGTLAIHVVVKSVEKERHEIGKGVGDLTVRGRRDARVELVRVFFVSWSVHEFRT